MQGIDKTRFREALIARMELTGIGATDLARRTGISKPQIDKLHQRKVETTNVHDALIIARFFGQSLEDFMGMAKKSAKNQELADILATLPPDDRDLLAIQIKALAAAAKP